VAQPLIVKPVFKTNAQWNDYVRNNDPSEEVYFQDDETCNSATDLSFNDCIHGGERKKSSIQFLSSCAGIKITDDLGAFDWTCKETSEGVVAYSLGLKHRFGLKDLIEMNGSNPVWKKNFITVSVNDDIFQESSPTVWWSNSLMLFPDSSAGTITINDDAQDTGRIFVLDNDANGDGHEVLDDKTGFTTLGNAIFTINSVNNCNSSTGGQLGGTLQCIFFSSGVDHIWLEGAYDTNSDTSSKPGVFFDLKFSQVRNLKVVNISDGGKLYIGGSSHGNRFISNEFRGNGGASSAYLGTAPETSHNLFYELVGANSTSAGTGRPFSIYGTNQVIIKTKVSNTSGNTAYGGSLRVSGSDNTVVDVYSNSSREKGISIGSGADNNTFLHMSTFNADVGLGIGNGTNENLVHNLLAVNNNYGISGGTTVDTNLSNMALINNETFGLSLHSNNGKLTGQLIVGNNGAGGDHCDIRSGVNPGYIQGTCTDTGTNLSNTYTGQASDALMIIGRDATNSFIGKVTVTDIENSTNTNGIQAYSSSNDFFNFENWYRSWGIDGSAFPASDNRGSCSSGTCRIWDFRLADTDTFFLNTSYSGVSSNDAFVAGQQCPTAVNGNETLTDFQTVPNTFLKHAMEIIFDDIGDDDGLCESDESCIYTPNYGSYQGEGDYIQNGRCNFTDGTVSNVSMFAYPLNGAL
jgi:hypothetical protein